MADAAWQWVVLQGIMYRIKYIWCGYTTITYSGNNVFYTKQPNKQKKKKHQKKPQSLFKRYLFTLRD